MKHIIILFILSLLAFSCSQPEKKQDPVVEEVVTEPIAEETESPATNLAFYSEINSYISDVVQQFDSIDDERKAQLKKLALYIKSKNSANEDVKIVYICTHNSRRSHMSQLWGMIAANHYGVEGVSTYSGGTEATAFNPRSVACLQRAGFKINQKTEGENPIYAVTYAEGAPAVESFSKVYTHESNPKENFVAVMTCSHADKNCPSVDGASMRIALPYEDPKAADNTPEESAVYDERCKQIAIEEFFLFSQVK